MKENERQDEQIVLLLEKADPVSGKDPRTPKAKKAKQVAEIPAYRNTVRDAYRLDDGTEVAIFYPQAIRSYDEEKQRFEPVEKTITAAADGAHFMGDKNGFGVRFNKEAESDELFDISHGQHRVTVFTKRNQKQKNKMCSVRSGESDTLVVSNAQTGGADLEYSVNGGGVKENIVIKKKAKTYRYAFVLKCENVTAEFDKAAKRVAFISAETGKEVFFIPAPFMTDANGAFSAAVSFDMKKTAEGDTKLTVMADPDWVNAEGRAFPVVIDPQINISGSATMTTYSWSNGNMQSGVQHAVGTTGSGDGLCNANRMYMSFAMPTLPRNPRTKKAELILTQASANISSEIAPKFGLFQVGPISFGACEPVQIGDLIDFAKATNGVNATYTFDITKLLDAVNKGESVSTNLVVKMLDENCQTENKIELFGATDATNGPKISVNYESSFGKNEAYRTHTHELGRFGQGNIDLACGNLMFDAEDFAWAGNRMPVTIRHQYNSALADLQYTANENAGLNLADFSAMKVGNGFRLNLMQSMVPGTFVNEGNLTSGYICTDENGCESYFKEGSTTRCCESNSQCYTLYDDVNAEDVHYDPVKRTLESGGETRLFDEQGRLIQITDADNNSMTIAYVDGKIASVTDGAGRVFEFEFVGAYLASIKAPDGTAVHYTYDGSNLRSITYPNGKQVTISYVANKPREVILYDGAEVVYAVHYAFTGDRLTEVKEYGVKDRVYILGARTEYNYSAASRRTVVTTYEQADGDEPAEIIRTVYTFDDEGDVLSQYLYSQDTGNVGLEGEQSGIHPISGDGSDVSVSVVNLLKDPCFKYDIGQQGNNAWRGMRNSLDCMTAHRASESTKKFGFGSIWMYSNSEDDLNNGIYQQTDELPTGEYTFSAYVRINSDFSGGENPGAFLRVVAADGSVIAESEHLTSKFDFLRVVLPFELATAQAVQVQLVLNGMGNVNFDGVQLETGSYANMLNLLENGGFENGTQGWTVSDNGVDTDSATSFGGGGSLTMAGDINGQRMAYQQIPAMTGATTRETFTLSGWARGYGLPAGEHDLEDAPNFGLRAEIKYRDDDQIETHDANFSPCTEEWQFASVQFSKEKLEKVEFIRVCADYSNNWGNAYFDNIQLVRNSVEFDVTESTVSAVVDNESENETGFEDDVAPEFAELKDIFGNALTETTFTDGEFGTIYRAFGFSENGNDLIRETDARGGETAYTVDAATSRNEEVTDRCGNKTAYEYDDSGRTTKVTSATPQRNEDGTEKTDADGNVIYDEIANVSYAYDGFDNMTEIVRGDGMKYALAYNAFHNLESIGIDKKDEKLVTYTYKNGNGRLKQVTYANGHTMKATYNSIGQMIAEKWYDGETLIAEYRYIYDGQGNIVRSLDFAAKKEYSYQYEEGHITQAVEKNITVNNDGVVTSKTVVNTVLYLYDAEGNMIRKRILSAQGDAQDIWYEKPEDGNTMVKFVAGDRTVTSHSKSDSFGRKVFDELQLGTGFVSRQFSYHAGEKTDEHATNGKLKSSPTTRLVSQIVLSGGRSISYEYDAEERITKVDDSVDGITLYTYDALGQLSTEKIGEFTTKFEYDQYGNIRAKGVVDETGEIAEATKITYDYSEGPWKDLLIGYNGQSITYDAQGNPISYLGHTLTWEKGRQLKSFDGITYTYNANGIRTSKTVDGVRHEYVLDGTKILRETWGENVLVPLYDNEDSVCGICFNSEYFYFQKNLHGDVISITDKEANEVAKYTYDAWGVCTIVSDTSACSIATINPFRYRGYYYDSETLLYYLQNRYYNAGIGRFINADIPELLSVSNTPTHCNLFVYCENNPVSDKDTIGRFGTIIAMAIGAVFGLFVQYVMDVVCNLFENKRNFMKPRSSIWDYITAGLSGALAATGIGKMAAAFLGGLLAVMNTVANSISSGKKASGLDILLSAVVGVISGLIGGSGANLKKVSSVVKVSKSILKTAVSPKKIAMYLGKIKSAAINTIVNGIRYILSAIAGAIGGQGKKYILGLI